MDEQALLKNVLLPNTLSQKQRASLQHMSHARSVSFDPTGLGSMYAGVREDAKPESAFTTPPQHFVSQNQHHITNSFPHVFYSNEHSVDNTGTPALQPHHESSFIFNKVVPSNDPSSDPLFLGSTTKDMEPQDSYSMGMNRFTAYSTFSNPQYSFSSLINATQTSPQLKSHRRNMSTS
jgi:hypothetical protein